MNNLLEKAGMNGIIRMRWFWIILLAALLVPAFIGSGKLTMDSSNESFMPEDDPVSLKNDAFKEIFGSEEFFYILIEADDIYSAETLERIRDFENDLKKNLPFLDDITSIYSAEMMESDGFSLNTRSMADDGIPDDDAELAVIREKQLASLLYRNRLISADGKAAGIFITLKKIPDEVYARTAKGYSPFSLKYRTRGNAVTAEDILDGPDRVGDATILEDPRKAVAATLLTLLSEHNNAQFGLTATGLPIIDYGSDAMTSRESGFFGLLSLITAAVLLIFLYRDIRALIGPLFVFGLTAFYLFGLMGLTGMKFSIMTIVLIPLLLVISVGYSIHMVNMIRKALANGRSREESVRFAYAGSAWPCFLTAITTAAGFVSFLFVPLAPIRQLGLECAIGTMLAFLLVMVIIPLFYFYGKTQKAAGRKTARQSERWISWNNGLIRNGKIILAGTLLICVLAGVGFASIRPSSDMLRIIGKRADFVRDASHVSDFLGGAYSAEFLIELPEAGMATQSDVLNALDEAAKMSREYGSVNLTISLSDLVLELDRIFRNVSPGDAVIPDRQDAIAQYLLMYETSGGDVLESWTDLDYSTLRLSVIFSNADSDIDNLGEKVGSYLSARLPPGTQVTLTGDLPVLMRMMELLIQSQIKSCLAALGFIALLLILILKSLRLGGLAIIPNLFPILFILGLMGIVKIPLDFVTAMIAPMLIGIAVDDTMHFFIHYRQERDGSDSPERACEKTFLSVGNALVFTSIVLTGGFVLFVFSKMKSLQNLGILAAAGIISALFADLCLSPLLLKRFDKNTISRRIPNDRKTCSFN